MKTLEEKAVKFALQYSKEGSDHFHTLRMSYKMGYQDRQLEELQKEQESKTELFSDLKALM